MNPEFEKLFQKGLPVQHATLHQALQSPGLPAEKTISSAKFKNIQMALSPLGLHLIVNQKCVTIPSANVVNCTHV